MKLERLIEPSQICSRLTIGVSCRTFFSFVGCVEKKEREN